jgi:Cyclin-dependent kinase inhibitor 3 (CDKN3)
MGWLRQMAIRPALGGIALRRVTHSTYHRYACVPRAQAEEVALIITELPFGLPGRVYRSAMPFGLYDPDGEVFKEYIRHRITAIVLLAGDVECLEKAGRDLYDFYTASGYRVIHLPISDFGVPSKGELAKAVSETLQLAVQGHNTAIHCSGGIGRTGMFLACMAQGALGLGPDEAIAWVRARIPGAVQTDAQRQMVIDFGA